MHDSVTCANMKTVVFTMITQIEQLRTKVKTLIQDGEKHHNALKLAWHWQWQVRAGCCKWRTLDWYINLSRLISHFLWRQGRFRRTVWKYKKISRFRGEEVVGFGQPSIWTETQGQASWVNRWEFLKFTDSLNWLIQVFHLKGHQYKVFCGKYLFKNNLKSKSGVKINISH